MTDVQRFRVDREGVAVLLRGLVGFASVAAAFVGAIVGSGVALVGCVWFDAATGYVARRFGPKSQGTVAIELFADTTCFVFAPIAFALAATSGVAIVILALAVFCLAGIFRLARFSIEGIQCGRYTGLPVTYGGYIVPLLGVLGHLLPEWSGIIFTIGLLILSALMVTRRLSVPEL